jgi:hypothetical protein
MCSRSIPNTYNEDLQRMEIMFISELLGKNILTVDKLYEIIEEFQYSAESGKVFNLRHGIESWKQKMTDRWMFLTCPQLIECCKDKWTLEHVYRYIVSNVKRLE